LQYLMKQKPNVERRRKSVMNQRIKLKNFSFIPSMGYNHTKSLREINSEKSENEFYWNKALYKGFKTKKFKVWIRDGLSIEDI